MPNKHTNEDIEKAEKWFVDIMDDFCCGNCQPFESKCIQSQPEYNLIQAALQALQHNQEQLKRVDEILALIERRNIKQSSKHSLSPIAKTFLNTADDCKDAIQIIRNMM